MSQNHQKNQNERREGRGTQNEERREGSASQNSEQRREGGSQQNQTTHNQQNNREDRR